MTSPDQHLRENYQKHKKKHHLKKNPFINLRQTPAPIDYDMMCSSSNMQNVDEIQKIKFAMMNMDHNSLLTNSYGEIN